MATLEHEDTGFASPRRPAIRLPKVRWTQILAISIFWFALNLHWSALGIIILPSQVFKMVGDAQKGEALAFVLVPGAFVSLFANPLFGMLSDKTRGRLAAWGRRRPYILVGTLVNAGGLIWMAAARDIPTLAIAYVLVQFSSNAAQAPFLALPAGALAHVRHHYRRAGGPDARYHYFGARAYGDFGTDCGAGGTQAFLF